MARLERPETTSAVSPLIHKPTVPPAWTSLGETVLVDQATLGKSLIVKGEVSGSESLFIDGKVEGAIILPGNRVTIGRNGQVNADISAREIVVLGTVRGNCHALDRVDIRSEGSLTGNVIAARISIEDGAFFKGGIDIRTQGENARPSSDPAHRSIAIESSPLAASYDLRAEESISLGRYRTLENEADLEDAFAKRVSAHPLLTHART